MGCVQPVAERPLTHCLAPSAPVPLALCPVPVPGEALGVQRGRQKPVVRRTPAPATPSHSAPLAVRSPTLRPTAAPP